MESNWRFNVWELGMSFSGWDFIARIIDPGPIPTYLLGMKGTGFFGVGEVLGVNQPITITHAATSPFRFPHQIAAPVTPDH